MERLILEKLSEGAKDQRWRGRAVKAYLGLLKHVRKFKGRFSDSFNVGDTQAWDLDAILGRGAGLGLTVAPGPLGHSVIGSRNKLGQSGSSHFVVTGNGLVISWDLRVSPSYWEESLDDSLDRWMENEKITFIHEYTHALDYKRLGATAYQKAQPRSQADYLRNASEGNAFFQSLASHFFLELESWSGEVEKALSLGKEEDAVELISWAIPVSFKDFIKETEYQSKGTDRKWIKSLSGKARQSYIKRLLQAYRDLQKKVLKKWPRLKGKLKMSFR